MRANTQPKRGDALLIVDMQRDFMPGGALPVPHADQLVPVINRCLRYFTERTLPLFASRDWHPPGHASFAVNGGPWPVHCVQGSPGAEFVSDLLLPPGTIVVDKGASETGEGYSAFENPRFLEQLHELDVHCLWVCGVATDYCVRATVLDALRHGFHVRLLWDGVAAVDAQPGDGERAIEEMMQAGAAICTSEGIIHA
ncbi:MAG: isochorismatase family protein [Zetaproteobacteria bacterium]|nr:MAG: isochorismatase family protein [Zetaproteobacteria bacterium]